MLGVPTVADRIAQTVVTLALEPQLEPHFHEDSYGYRPRRSAHQALTVTRQRCWDHDWVLEYDIRGLFDNIDHNLLFKALRRHTDEKWILLYVSRWLTTPMQSQDGTLVLRNKGTPQGGPLSPLLANLFMHYALDSWLVRTHPQVPFCRYADDGVIHCQSLAHANNLREQLSARLAVCGLELHPDKTRVVYCKDANRKQAHDAIQFDFLGFTFRPRMAINRRGRVFLSFSPALSRAALTDMRQTIRRWRLQLRSDLSLEELGQLYSPVIRGWMSYYTCFRPSAFQRVAEHIDRFLIRWAMRKFKRLKGHWLRALRWLRAQSRSQPGLFPHWGPAGRFRVGSTGAR
jgi:RNA-directed DNA polymerase